MEEILKKLHEEALSLKKSIKLIDMISERTNSSSGEYAIKQLIFKPDVNVKIKMYQENHNEPHIHVDIGRNNHNASISIRNQEVLAGKIEKKYEKKVLEWVKKNKDNLIIIWNSMQSGEVVNLAPLN